MEIIKIGINYFSVESFNHYMSKMLVEINDIDIYSYVESASLGIVPTVDFEKLRDKKEQVKKAVRIGNICKKFLSHSNRMKLIMLMHEFEIKREDLYN